MSDYSSLKATINANVKANNNHEITGSIMNSVLNAMVDSLGAGYQFMGVATPTNPGSAQTPDYKCFYLATTPGTYTYLGGLVVADGEVALLKYDSSWTKEVTGIASADKLNQLGQTPSVICVNANVFLPNRIIPDYAISNLSPYYPLQPYTANKVVTSCFYKIPSNASRVIISGINAINIIRARFSDTPQFTPTNAIAIDITPVDGIASKTINLADYSGYSYLCVTVYRGAQGSTPDLSNVNITFVSEDTEQILPTSNIFNADNILEDKTIAGQIPFDVITLTSSKIVLTDFITIPSEAKGIYFSGISLNSFGRVRFSKTKTLTTGVGDDKPLMHPIPTTGSGYIKITDEMRPYKYLIFTAYRGAQGTIPDFSNVDIHFDYSGKDGYDNSMEQFQMICPHKGAIAIGMDMGTMVFASGFEQFLAKLIEYHLTCQFAFLPETLTDTANYDTEKYITWMKNLYCMGYEILVHSDTHLDVSETSTLTIEQVRDGIKNYLDVFYSFGVYPTGWGSISGVTKDEFKPIIDEYFNWALVNKNINLYTAPESYAPIILNQKAQQYDVRRGRIELTPEQATAEGKAQIVANAKSAIDAALADKGVLVLFAHSYDVVGAAYTLYPDVFDEILTYIQTKRSQYRLLNGDFRTLLSCILR